MLIKSIVVSLLLSTSVVSSFSDFKLYRKSYSLLCSKTTTTALADNYKIAVKVCKFFKPTYLHKCINAPENTEALIHTNV